MAASTKGATILQARVAAAHEGEAELVISIGFDNGGTSEVTLDQIASAALMESCQAMTLEDLQGHGWEQIKAALQVSYNRFQ